MKYIASDAVYLDGGRSAGLAEGMKLTIHNGPGLQDIAAELEIVTVADTSAVCTVKSSKQEIRVGDEAELSAEDAQTIQALQSLAGQQQYAQVVTFTEGDPLDEEARKLVPRPPSPAVNRTRGRIGFEYNSILDHTGNGMRSSQEGMVLRADMTRIGGSYWNLSGFWRGRINSHASSLQTATLYDLLNRTYHLTLYYDNPESNWRMGFGRFYLPWATSLDTIDGGYLARRVSKHVTGGMFAGSTPDPTSWNYNPNRQMLGSFLNYDGGDFDNWKYSTTGGLAVSRVGWRPERQFAFLETSIFYKRYFSIYHNLEVDQFRGAFASNGRRETGLSRSFLTLRIQPVNRLAIDFSDNYFRNVPTFDPRLVSTGLIDRLLFTGISVGLRLDLPYKFGVYTNLGRSDRTGDARHSLNQMYGLFNNNVWRTGLRIDARFSRFDSAFGRGTYQSIQFARDIGEALRFDVEIGEQNIVSTLSAQNRAHFVNSTLDWFLSRHYFLGGGYTFYRGKVQNYDQLFMNLGYRF